MKFCHLHTHTDASLRDGLGTVQRLVETARSLGFTALAMTDHGTLANVITFYTECKHQDIKPIIGLEAYVTYAGRKGHVTLLADGDRGLNTLIDLDNMTHQSKEFALPLEVLFKKKDGLILLSGCQASPFQTLAKSRAEQLAIMMKSIWGNRLFFEAMAVNDFPHAARAKYLAEYTNSKVVITNDVHFPDPEEVEIHKLLTQMKSNFSYADEELYMKTPDEIFERFSSLGWEPGFISEALERSQRIAELIDEYTIIRPARLPSFAVDADEILWDKVFKILKRFPSTSEKRRIEYDRATEELNVIREMGYSNYFLILDDIIGWAKSRGIKIGPGRGSGAGSFVLFVLGITEIDPLEYDLPFERFLNKNRIGMPDVDVDIDNLRRHEVIDYAKEKWRAVPIATYSRYNHKSLVHDLCKVLKIPKELELPAAEFGPDGEPFENLKKGNALFSNAYDSIIGQIRHKGKHAGGVVITDAPVPIERAGDELVAAWTEGRLNELSKAGIVKFDLLGLSALAILANLEQRTGLLSPRYEDCGAGAEFDIFTKEHLTGIFQFSGSYGIMDYTTRFKPKSLEDLIVINALYRPGALDVGVTEKFLEWKDNPRKDVPSIVKNILEPTYGAIVFQEQVMQIFARITRGSLAEADEARRIIVKSKEKGPEWRKKFAKFRGKFLEAATESMTLSQAKKLFEEVAAHSRYSFNKAHATAYAYIAWQMAWWKSHYSREFYAALIDVDPYELQSYVIDARFHGIEIVPPHINFATDACIVESGKVYLPLTVVKYLSDRTAYSIVKDRQLRGKFVEVKDVIERIPKRIFRSNARLGLAAIGGFEGLRIDKSLAEDLETTEIPEFSYKTQLAHMGVVIPTKKTLSTLYEINEEEGVVAGIITEVSHRTSSYGDYQVYRLLPSAVFWTRGLRIREPGEIIAAEVKKNKATYIEGIVA